MIWRGRQAPKLWVLPELLQLPAAAMNQYKRRQSNAKRMIWCAGAALLIIALLLYGFYRQPIVINPSHVDLPADGREHDAFRIRLPRLRLGSTVTDVTDRSVRFVEAIDPSGRTIRGRRGAIGHPSLPGRATISSALALPQTFRIPASDLRPSIRTDTYSDGTPGFSPPCTHPSDRQAFRDWFTSIAETSRQIEPRLTGRRSTIAPPCSASAYREALRAVTTRSWLQQPSYRGPALPSIVPVRVPANPARMRTCSASAPAHL